MVGRYVTIILDSTSSCRKGHRLYRRRPCRLRKPFLLRFGYGQVLRPPLRLVPGGRLGHGALATKQLRAVDHGSCGACGPRGVGLLKTCALKHLELNGLTRASTEFNG